MAQSPMQNTVRDFWKMVHSLECASIIMLCEFKENDKVNNFIKFTHVLHMFYTCFTHVLHMFVKFNFVCKGSLCSILA